MTFANDDHRDARETGTTGWWARVAGPLAERPAGPVEILAWAIALATAGYIVWSVGSVVGWVLAVALPLVVIRWPVAGITAIAVLTQEITSKGHYGVLTRLGNQVYYSQGKVPILLLLAATAACAAIARTRPMAFPRLRVTDWILLGSATGLVVLAAVSGLIHGQSIVSALNQNARPFVLVILGCVVGASLRSLKREARSLEVIVGLALVGLLAAAAVAIALGQSADARVSHYFIFYDTALPAVAAAALIALVGAPKHRWSGLEIAVLVTAPILILISFRRSVWLAAPLVFVVSLALTRSRWARLGARATLAAAATVLVVGSAPGFAADVIQRSGAGAFFSADTPTASAPATVSPTVTTSPPTTPASAAPIRSPQREPTAKPAVQAQSLADSDSGHLGDLRLGWRYVQENFWTGAGPVSPQIDGMAARDAARIYVHNEFLQEWLRYGPAGPLLVILFFSAAGLRSLRILHDSNSNVVARSAAAFCLICPPCLMTAPFLSETSRWPLLVGLAGGVLILWRPEGSGDSGRGQTEPARCDGGADDATVQFPRPAFRSHDDATVEFPRLAFQRPDEVRMVS